MEPEEKTPKSSLLQDRKTDYGLSNAGSPEISDNKNENPTKDSKDNAIPGGGEGMDRSPAQKEEKEKEERLCFKGITRKEILLLFVMGLVEVSIQSFLSLLGPFFAMKVSHFDI